MARHAGLSNGVVLKYKRGDSEPTLSRLKAIAEAGGVAVEWLATGAEGTLIKGQPAPPTPSPGAKWTATADDKPMPLREGPPQSYGAASSKAIATDAPLSAEEAQFATFQVWREVVAATHMSMQRHGLLAKDIDPLDLADHVAKLVVEYARGAAKERKTLARRLANDDRILQLKKTKGRQSCLP